MPDPYCYPNSHILINKLNITDPAILHNAERDLTYLREAELLLFRPLDNMRFDFQSLKDIHHYLFQDIYDWAGKVRTVDIAKSNLFCKVGFIDTMANEIFTELKNEQYLQKGYTKEHLAKRLAYYLSEINALHPFREGNGRSQREFIRQLAYANGYLLSYANISKDEMIKASQASFLRDYRLIEDLILLRLRPISW